MTIAALSNQPPSEQPRSAGRRPAVLPDDARARDSRRKATRPAATAASRKATAKAATIPCARAGGAAARAQLVAATARAAPARRAGRTATRHARGLSAAIPTFAPSECGTERESARHKAATSGMATLHHLERIPRRRRPGAVTSHRCRNPCGRRRASATRAHRDRACPSTDRPRWRRSARCVWSTSSRAPDGASASCRGARTRPRRQPLDMKVAAKAQRVDARSGDALEIGDAPRLMSDTTLAAMSEKE